MASIQVDPRLEVREQEDPGDVGADGTLAAFHGNAAAFTSLAAVSYPTSAIKPRKLTLTPGWTSSQAAYDTGDPSYAISRGVVSMAEAKHTSPLWTHLPAQVRAAAHLLLIETYTDGGTAGVNELHNGLGDVSSNPFANARVRLVRRDRLPTDFLDISCG